MMNHLLNIKNDIQKGKGEITMQTTPLKWISLKGTKRPNNYDKVLVARNDNTVDAVMEALYIDGKFWTYLLVGKVEFMRPTHYSFPPEIVHKKEK